MLIRPVPLRALLVAGALLLAGTRALAFDPPQLTRYVTDLAGVMSPAAVDALDRTLAGYAQSTSSQFVVLVVPSLDGGSIEDAALAVAEKNKIGREGKDNGLLLLVAVNDRKLRFEVGYGLEPVLTDALTSVIIRDVIAPRFRDGDYDAGITAGMQAAIQAAGGEFTAPEPVREKKKRGMPIGVIIFLIILFIVLRKGGRRGGRGGGIFIIPGGFGGGGFGGGGFSGGGGFGGFSGGGGSFGGGGSSGSW